MNEFLHGFMEEITKESAEQARPLTPAQRLNIMRQRRAGRAFYSAGFQSGARRGLKHGLIVGGRKGYTVGKKRGRRQGAVAGGAAGLAGGAGGALLLRKLLTKGK